MDKYKTGYECLDKREENIMSQINILSSSGEFIEAVKNNDYKKCKEILNQYPNAINSIDNSDKRWSSVHYACQ